MFHLDYLTICIGDFDQTLSFYKGLIGEDEQTTSKPLKYSTRSIAFPNGACIADYTSYCYLTLPGIAINELSARHLKAIIDRASGATRIDCTWDNVEATVFDIRAEANANLYTASHANGHNHLKSIWWDSEEGQTLYMGAASSERRVRFYNMHGFTRMEYQFRRDYAEACVRNLQAHPFSRWPAIAAAHARNLVEFPSVWFQSAMGLPYLPLAKRKRTRKYDALEAMLIQYRAALRRLSTYNGNDPDTFYEYVLSRLR